MTTSPREMKVTITADSGPCLKAIRMFKEGVVSELHDIMGLEQGEGLDDLLAELRIRLNPVHDDPTRHSESSLDADGRPVVRDASGALWHR